MNTWFMGGVAGRIPATPKVGRRTYMPVMRRPLADQIPWWVWPPILFLVVVLAGLFSPYAHATPATDGYTATHMTAVCLTLDAVPTNIGLLGVAAGIQEDNPAFSLADIAQVITDSVLVACPRHLPLLKAAAARAKTQVV